MACLYDFRPHVILPLVCGRHAITCLFHTAELFQLPETVEETVRHADILRGIGREPKIVAYIVSGLKRLVIQASQRRTWASVLITQRFMLSGEGGGWHLPPLRHI